MSANKLFVDFKGKRSSVVDADSGEVQGLEVSVQEGEQLDQSFCSVGSASIAVPGLKKY